MSSHLSEYRCICETLQRIDEAQRDVIEEDCSFSKEDLFHDRPKYNTIPLLLIKKGCGDYFIGTGVYKSEVDHTFKCVKTPFFRISSVTEEADGGCCLKLELLQAQCKDGNVPAVSCSDEVCDYLASGSVALFIRTGICISVEIDGLIGLECLPAVKAEEGVPEPLRRPKTFNVIKDELCGNYAGGNHTIWQTWTDSIIEGTFQVYASTQNLSSVTGEIVADQVIPFVVQPGETISRTVHNPSLLRIQSPSGHSGTYCLQFIKKVESSHDNASC